MRLTSVIARLQTQSRIPGLGIGVMGIWVPAFAGNPQGEPRQQDTTLNRE
jgi:hypothetical protein